MSHQRSCKVLSYPLASVSVVICLLMSAALAQPPDTPVLRIEAGMHTSGISRIDVDAQERFLVTASGDKTVRVWSLASGELLQILRPPIGPDDEGKLIAVAISPDGVTVAAAGWSGGNDNNIYLFDRASGRLQRRIAGLRIVIYHLAYSPDGRHLAAVLAHNGIRVYETRDYREIARDVDYGDLSFWAEFDLRGRLVTSSNDGYVRLYDTQFKRVAKRKAPGGEQPYAVGFSRDSTLVAVGFADTTAVNVLDGEDLSFRYAPDTSSVTNGSLNGVAWSRDGQRLYAGGTYRESLTTHSILQWSQAGRGQVTTLPAASSSIRDLRALTDGRLAFGAADPAFGIFDAHGAKMLTRGRAQVEYRGHRAGLGVSHDGSAVAFVFNTITSDNPRFLHRARLHLSEGRLLVNSLILSASGLALVQRRLAELATTPDRRTARRGRAPAPPSGPSSRPMVWWRMASPAPHWRRRWVSTLRGRSPQAWPSATGKTPRSPRSTARRCR